MTLKVGDRVFIDVYKSPLIVTSVKKWSARAIGSKGAEFLIVNDEDCNGFSALPQNPKNRGSFKVVRIETV